MTRAHRILISVVAIGVLAIATIGFAGSYAAVRELALRKGFGIFANVFPIGVDAGIVVLLALDLLLTWFRIPFPLLRQTAWLLTIATVAFNAAAASDPLGMGMHAVIPVLFVVSVEAARHAIGRIADITADKHMEGVRITRWLLAPVPTFLLWRRMKLWELRSYDQVIRLEQERLVYQARLHSRFGRGWRRKAPVESLMPLRLARYGVPLTETAAAGLAAASIEAPVGSWFAGPEVNAVPGAAGLEGLEPAPTVEADSAAARSAGGEALEPAGGWNNVHGDTADDRLEGAVQGRVEREVAYAGAPPARTQADRVPIVHARLPLDDLSIEGELQDAEPDGELEPDHGLEPDGLDPVALIDGHTVSVAGVDGLQGREAVEALLKCLPGELRGRSANSLAPHLAPVLDLSVGTTRKYIGEVRQERTRG
ncbi:DUF2637 domain-containing protein [Streptantibioticus ferralitis]|uniref:DUF2637 domain-containing protein n=1 Tax=Streptantibioticus ferralitis TaxID=236510 RepID=A0ABT5Z7A1_9ACTN|nr:DUF2637 domain-containing protein [Streptantibioticus ferralitis]MDF2259707.1 DUF2637 domain-containing protein [Streptantibioticus ferralitis]